MTEHCTFCNNKPALTGGMTVYVALEEKWPRTQKEQFKVKLEGGTCEAEIHFCTECETEQVVQRGRIVATGKNK